MSAARPDPRRGTVRAFLLLAALETAVFVLSCQVALRGRPANTGRGDSLIARLLGSGRQALSSHFYGLSDLTFHRGGFGHLRPRAARTDWFARIHDLMYQRRHLHLEGVDRREVLPWLRLATRADPHFLEPWLVASFTLRQLHDVAAARRLLEEAQAANPHAAEIAMELGRVALAEHRFRRARADFTRALALLDRYDGAGADPHLAATALLYKGLLDEMQADREAALAAYTRFLALRPGDGAIRQRREALLRGDAPVTRQAPLLHLLDLESGGHGAACGCDADEHDDHHHAPSNAHPHAP